MKTQTLFQIYLDGLSGMQLHEYAGKTDYYTFLYTAM